LACADAIALIAFVTPGPAVSAATPGRRVTFAQPSAANAAVCFVANVDDVDALRPAAVVDREQMPTREREELRDAVRLQPAGDEWPPTTRTSLALDDSVAIAPRPYQ